MLSIRTTYIKYIIPEDVLKNSMVSFKNHEGFKGNEYAALKLFCEFHNLKQPYFPILAPEYSKPLFLKIICEAVKETEEKRFPQGFQGISEIFKLYIQTLNSKFERKREVYKNRKIVEKAVLFLVHECFNKDERELSLEEAFDLFDKKFPKFDNLINDLIEEDVFIRKVQYDYTVKLDEEVIYFSYERLGDFFIADDILNRFKTSEEVLEAFKINGEFGKLNNYGFWGYNGIFEAFSVLLPEKFNLEIYEVYSWVFDDKNIDEFRKRNDGYSINRFFLDSLNWRKIESINEYKVTEWLRSKSFNLDYDEYLLKLYELAPVKGHPFNSDRLFKILNGIKMPERDGFWQKHMLWYSSYNDEEIAFPIRRLIDWAWTPGISKSLDFETTRLTAMSLVWLLSSSHRKLRDETTKALVNLLEQQPKVLLSVLNAFKNIDDLYILERIYAVVYGCILRAEKIESITEIATAIYDYNFKNGNPPSHILLRDYARNSIEYAVYKNPSFQIDISLVRPPYQSKMPEYFPSIEEIKEYEFDSDTLDFKKYNGRMHNLIPFSVLEWDFGRKIIDNKLYNIHFTAFTFEEDYKVFFKSLNKKQKEIITLIKQSKIQYSKLLGNEYNAKNKLGTEKYEIFKTSIEDFLKRLLIDAENIFEVEQMFFLRNKVLPYFKNANQEKNYNNTFDSQPIKRWIVKRVFELGYDCKKHGDYDRFSEDYSQRSETKIERIGKKYQWIALFEILANIVDNHKVYDDFSGRYDYYKGPWQMYLRDIDPVFITRGVSDDNNETKPIIDSKNWYDEPVYNNWISNDSKWVEDLSDLPSVRSILEKTDDEKEGWLFLKKFSKWTEPKSVGQDEYKRRRKEVFYKLQGYLIDKRDKTKIVRWLSEQNFWGDWMPELSVPLTMINRENFWSPIYKNTLSRRKWETISDTNYKVIVASIDAVGEMADDKSGARYYYDMPCKTLFEGMGLKYTSIDGEFANERGEIMAKNIKNRGLIIKKEALLHYLEENNLELVWTLLGEKMSYDSRERKQAYFKELSGAFHIENDAIKGEIISFNRR